MAIILCLLVGVVFFAILNLRSNEKRKGPVQKINRSDGKDVEEHTRSSGHTNTTNFPPADTTGAEKQSHVPSLSGAAFVVDGDSLVINKMQIRLFGIDAPELNHPYGKNAKWALVSLCKGQMVRAEITAKDAFGRTVAKCYLQDGRDLSEEMVKLGLAIDWPKFSGGQYRSMEVPNARKKMWLADARQRGLKHVWEKYDAQRFTANEER